MKPCFISVPALTQYLRMAESCGLDYSTYLEHVGISPALINDNCNRVSSELLEALLLQLIPDSKDPFFGLHTSRYIQQDSYSVLGYIGFSSSSLKALWQHVPVYEKIVGDMGTSHLLLGKSESCFQWQCNLIDPLVRFHITENVFASWYRYAKLIFQFDEHPNRIYFAHKGPDAPHELNYYRDFFQCDVLFNQAFNGIWVDNRIVNLQIPQANAQLLATLLGHATQVLESIDKQSSVADRVKNLLRLMMVDNVPCRETIAQHLCMSSRHLQRKLNDEGTGYNEVLQELRLELAKHYLVNTDMSIDQIAIKLGLSETRSFYRSFKHWTGKTVGEYRKNRQPFPSPQ
jgi:AraC-like DNA-binding protein